LESPFRAQECVPHGQKILAEENGGGVEADSRKISLIPMILYKYLPAARLDVLEHKRIRFTQPGDFNDPFEFRPQIQEVVSDKQVQSYVEANYEKLLEEELAKYGALIQQVPPNVLKELLLKQKAMLPEVFSLLKPEMLQKVTPMIDGFLNDNVGALCLSEVRDSILMWGHYAENHQGIVVGFNSGHPFFSKRRSEHDEFGFLRRVNYQSERPKVVLSDTSSIEWFQTKSAHWEYEKEWRILRVLSEAARRIDSKPFPVCLFEFDEDSIAEIIVGMRSSPSTIEKVRSLSTNFPGANLLQTREDSSKYSLIIDNLN
jgi:hypothetical protein